jgi:hypothetical protein
MWTTYICNFILCNFVYIIDLHVHLLLMQICGSTITSHFCSLLKCIVSLAYVFSMGYKMGSASVSSNKA